MRSLLSPDRVQIQTERLLLRLLHRGDEPAMVRFYTENREFLAPFSPVFGPELFTVRGWRQRIDATLAEYRSGKGLRLVMFSVDAPSIAIGVVNFTSITGFPTYQCNLGYSISATDQGKGLMTEALLAATAYAFDELGLHRIEANYMPQNKRSERVLQRLGFVVEGHAKDYIQINGRWEDHVKTSLTNDSWTL